MSSVRRQRTRSDRNTPAGTVYVGRGSFWANPFLSARFGHVRAHSLHRAWLRGRLTVRALRLLGFNDREIEALERLRQRQIECLGELAVADVTCWCSLRSRYCHADTLAGLAALDAPTLEQRLAA